MTLDRRRDAISEHAEPTNPSQNQRSFGGRTRPTVQRAEAASPVVRGSVDDDPYLALRTLAAYGGLSVRTLRSYLTHPSTPLPHYRIGGKILVRRSEYDRWASQFHAHVAAVVDKVVDDVLRSLT